MTNGKLIGKNITPTAEVAPNGVWNLVDQYVYNRRDVWPVATSDLLTISPSLNGELSWDGSTPLSFDSTGEYTITPAYDTTVDVKMWGAGGACGYTFTDPITSTNNQGPGGGGGYSSATIILRANVDYIFRIGEGGIRTVTTDFGATHLAGGIQTANGGAQGGGYTGIFKSSVSQPNALLIAGGGGGGGDGRYSNYAGAGGGGSGQNFSGSIDQGGLGGTQSAGGAASRFNNATAGSALLGGLGQSNESSLGGGGGGYFGGGGGNAGGGGGGSGRIGTDVDVSNGVTTTGSSSTPGNSSDADRGGAGQGGVAGSTSGTDGKILLTFVSSSAPTGSTPAFVTSGLVLHLDASDTNSYPGSGTTWFDLTDSNYDFTINSSAFNSSGPKYMDFGGLYGAATLPSNTSQTGDITYVLATRILESTATWRTLTRGNGTGDHHVIIESGSYDMGMYDNTGGTAFQDSGYDQSSLPNFGTSDWIILYFRWSAGGGYKMSYNDTPEVIRADLSGNSNARYDAGFIALGMYHVTPSQYWGDIAMFAMYDRYLTDQELLQNYNSLKSRFGL